MKKPFTLEDGTKGFIVVVNDVPMAYWERYDRAWWVDVYKDGNTSRVPMTRDEVYLGGCYRDDALVGKYSDTARKVFIPSEYFTNELGEIGI